MVFSLILLGNLVEEIYDYENTTNEKTNTHTWIYIKQLCLRIQYIDTQLIFKFVVSSVRYTSAQVYPILWILPEITLMVLRTKRRTHKISQQLKSYRAMAGAPPPSTRSNFSKWRRAFLILMSVAADTAKINNKGNKYM